MKNTLTFILIILSFIGCSGSKKSDPVQTTQYYSFTIAWKDPSSMSCWTDTYYEISIRCTQPASGGLIGEVLGPVRLKKNYGETAVINNISGGTWDYTVVNSKTTVVLTGTVSFDRNRTLNLYCASTKESPNNTKTDEIESSELATE